jgi:hypothetical protein
MPHTGAPRARRRSDFRDRPLGRVAIILVLLLAIFLVSRGCQREGIEITQDEAIAIAKDAVDFVPTREQVRLIRRGTAFAPQWAVSLAQEEEGELRNVTVVLVDARTGEVLEVRRA